MLWILKQLFRIALLAAVGLAGYAVLFDLPAPVRDVVVPLEIGSGGG